MRKGTYSPKAKVDQPESVPAPVKGLNDVDSVANMAPDYALILKNFFPNNSSISVRAGYAVWASGLVDPIQTLMSYRPRTDLQKLLAATDKGVFDVTTRAQASYPKKLTLTDGRLSWLNFSTTGKDYIVACNGVEPAFLYDGATFTNFTQVTTPANPGEISGVDPKKFNFVTAHKRRLWFVEKDSLTAWYLPVDSVGGAAKPFFLGSIFRRGGRLNNIWTWSLDSGSGMDDILIFQSDQGEIAGYEGTDPASADTWALNAVYHVASPLGRRTACALGGDLLLLTSYGVIPISKVIEGEAMESPSEASLSRNIAKTLNNLLQLRGTKPKWEIMAVPIMQAVIVMFPATDEFSSTQYVMNTVTNAWGEWDLPMTTMEHYNYQLFFGAKNGTVYQYGSYYLDDVDKDGKNGKPVTAVMMQAHNYFGGRGINKHFKFVRPIFVSNYQPAYSLNVSLDFAPFSPYDLGEPPLESAEGAIWGRAIWGQDRWTLSPAAHFKWDGIEGMGFSAALFFKVRANRPLEFISSDWLFEPATSI